MSDAVEWKEMAEAPRDGTVILLVFSGSTVAGYWSQHPRAFGGTARYPWVILDSTNGVNGLVEDGPHAWAEMPRGP